MFLNSRRFIVWLGSLLAVLLLYLVYSRLTGNVPVEDTTAERSSRAAVESNLADTNSAVGMIGDVGVGGMKQVRLVTYTAQKELERVVGFEEVLHKSGDVWEVEKPFIDLYRPDFTCRVTANKGLVTVETAAGRTTGKDAALSGDVAIRIFAADNNDVNEAVLYMDDVAFVGEGSRFSTKGFVELISSRGRLLGSGMELTYNEQDQRLENLKIEKLKRFEWKVASAPSLPAGGRAGAEKGDRGGPQAGPGAAGAYRCVLKDNVVISGPEQLVLADVVSVGDLFAAGGGRARQADKGRAAHQLPGGEPAAAVEKLQKVVVSCAGPVVIAPMDNERAFGQLLGEKGGDGPAFEKWASSAAADANGRAVLIAGRIDYKADTGEAIAKGGCEIRFSASDIADVNAAAAVVMKCSRQAEFRPADNEIRFVGDCRCTMVRVDGENEQKYALLAPQVLVRLSGKRAEKAGGVIAQVEHITAGGGQVRVASTKRRGKELPGGIELKCTQADYSAEARRFSALGPGVVKVDNSNVGPGKEARGRFTLRRKCYAFVRNFEKMDYFADANRLVADGGGKSLLIDYLPLGGPDAGRKVAVTAGRIEAGLSAGEDGRMELARLVARGAVTYEDKDKNFEGSEFLYDAKQGLVRAHGDELNRCIFNGVFVDGLEWDLSSDKVKVNITAPSAVQMK